MHPSFYCIGFVVIILIDIGAIFYFRLSNDIDFSNKYRITSSALNVIRYPGIVEVVADNYRFTDQIGGFSNTSKDLRNPKLSPEWTKKGWCNPLLPSLGKLGVLDTYRTTAAPLMYWHISKSGGISFCTMGRNWYLERKINFFLDSQGNCLTYNWQKLVANFSHWEADKQKGYKLMSLEPYWDWDYFFPVRMRKSDAMQVLLDSSRGDRHEEAWTNFVHAVTLRHPLDISISAFNFRWFDKLKKNFTSLHETCIKHTQSTDHCFQEMFSVADNLQMNKHSWFSKYEIHLIRTIVFGNYTLNHFSLIENVENAKAILRKFHLIVDLSMDSIASHLIRCTLGWDTVKRTTHANVNKDTSVTSILEELNQENFNKLIRYLKHDIEVYSYGVQLSISHYYHAIREVF